MILIKSLKDYTSICKSILLLFLCTCSSSALFAYKGMDLNNDGNTDLVSVSENANGDLSVTAYLSSGTSFSQTNRTNGGESYNELHHWFYGDFNGDGRTDIAKLWEGSGQLNCDVHTSNGSSFSIGMSIRNAGTYNYSDKWYCADFNGDGLSDLMRAYNNGGRSMDVHLSNGSGFDPVTIWATAQGSKISQQDWFTADFNGDGMTDVIALWGENDVSIEAHISTGNSFSKQTWGLKVDTKASKMKWLAEDFDGDGKAEIAYVTWTDNAVSIGVYNYENSTLQLENWAVDLNVGFDRNDHWLKGDFDGDGTVDIGRIKNENDMLSMDLFQSNGSSFAFSNAITQAVPYRDQTKYTVGDFNGDGMTDVAATWSDGDQIIFDIIDPSAGAVNSFGAHLSNDYFESRFVQETIHGDYFLNYGRIEGPVPNTTNLQAIMDAGNDVYLLQGVTYELPYTLTYKKHYQRLETYNALFLKDYARCLHTMDGEEVDSTLNARSKTHYISLENVIVDGNRYGGLPIKIRPGGEPEGAMVAFGVGEGHVVRRTVLMSSRTWSSCQIHEQSDTKDGLIEDNFVLGAGNGPRGSGRQLNESPLVAGKIGWGDGFSVAGRNTVVRRNFIMDCTDVGIVIFCAPGTEVYENMIFNMSRETLGAINMVDGIDYFLTGELTYDYQDTTVRNNTMSAIGARIQLGLPHSSKAWNNRDAKLFVGATIKDNHITGDAFGYGYILDSLQGVTVTGNTSDATHTGKGVDNNIPTAAAFLYNPLTVNAVQLQNDFVDIGQDMRRLLFMNGSNKGSDGYHEYVYTTPEAEAIVKASYLEMLGRNPTAAELTTGHDYFINDFTNTGDDFKRQLMGTSEFVGRFGSIDPNSDELHPFRVARWMNILNQLDSEELKSSGNFSHPQEIFDDAVAALAIVKDAEFISVDAPAIVEPGSTFEAGITVKNTSSFTWSRDNEYKLGSQSPQDNSNWGTNRVLIDAGDSVLPGETYTFTHSFTAPSSPGNYDFHWRMLEEGVTWFGPTMSDVSINVDFLTPDYAERVTMSVPTIVNSGESFNAEISVKNIGTTTWSAATGYQLASQNPVWGAVNAVPVDETVAPGETTTFTIPCIAPLTEGNVNFHWRMEQAGGFGPFGDFSNAIINVLVFKPSGLVDRTDEAGGIISSEYTDSPAAEGHDNLFDNDTATKYLTFNAGSWVQHQFANDNQYTIVWYTITSANDAEDRDPLNWTLSGSNDGVNWTTVDTRSGVNFPNRFQTLEFDAFSNTTAYEYYRFEAVNNSTSILQYAEIELFGFSNEGSDPYEAWKETHGIVSDTGDDDKDGIDNLMEFALAGDPNSASSGELPVVSKNGSDFYLRFHRGQDSITYTIQKSSDLINWTDHREVNDSNGTVGSEATVHVSNSEMLNGKLFLRLKVQQ